MLAGASSYCSLERMLECKGAPIISHSIPIGGLPAEVVEATEDR